MGRGSAFVVVVFIAVAMVMVVTEAAVYTVGDGRGWTFNVDSWPNGKRFRPGDVLVFNYNSKYHNVVKVNRGGYSSCSPPRGAKVYQTGKDRVTLVRGQNFFICSFAGHCQSGMKIAVSAI